MDYQRSAVLSSWQKALASRIMIRLCVAALLEERGCTVYRSADSADRAVVGATVCALQRVLHGAPRRRVVRLAQPAAPDPAPAAQKRRES